MIEVTSSFKLHLPGVSEVGEHKMENLPALVSCPPSTHHGQFNSTLQSVCSGIGTPCNLCSSIAPSFS